MIFATAAGNIGKDAETRKTQSGDSVTSFSLATESRNGSEKVTTWLDVSIWGKRGEALAQYLTKGGKITVAGTLSTRDHDGKTYLKINASEVALQGGGKSEGSGQRSDSDNSRGGYGDGGQSGYGAGGSPNSGGYGGSGMDDEIPFKWEGRV